MNVLPAKSYTNTPIWYILFTYMHSIFQECNQSKTLVKMARKSKIKKGA